MAMDSVSAIGRVGAPAVALGVGMAIASVPATAGTDDTGTNDTAATGGAAASPTTHSNARGARHAPQGAEPTVSGRMGATPADSVATRGRRSSAPTDPALDGLSPAEPFAAIPPKASPIDEPGPQSTPAPVPLAGISQSGAGPQALPDAPPASDQTPAVAPATELVPATEVVAAQRAEDSVPPAAAAVNVGRADAPVMTATPRATTRGSVSGSGTDVLAWLGANGTPDAPVAAPLAWAVAAVTRRELQASPAASAVASMTTSQPILLDGLRHQFGLAGQLAAFRLCATGTGRQGGRGCDRSRPPDCCNLDASGLSSDPFYLDCIENDPLAFAAADSRGLARELDRAWDRFGVELPRLTVPTLAVHGEIDPVAIPGAVRAYADQIGPLEYLELAGTRHDVLNDVTHREVTAAIVAFIAEQTQSRTAKA